jgi:hypothetical protein
MSLRKFACFGSSLSTFSWIRLGSSASIC